MELPILKISAMVVLGAAAVYFLYRMIATLLSRRSPRVLCPNCQLNDPRYCHLPARPRATLCEDYTPKGQH